MLVFTSGTKSYIPKARVLGLSLKKHHPTWEFQLILCDDLPGGFNIDNEPFDGVTKIDDLPIRDWKSWAFGHSVVELCTAVKGPAALLFSERHDVDKIMYLDPDVQIFNSLNPLNEMLENSDILLTPHLLDAEFTEQAIEENEICALRHGVFNLGFFAARTDGGGRQFIDWWANRLVRYCIADIPNGLFTDQRWCDLAPCFFERLHIVRDRGYNVATWNIAHRPLSQNAEGLLYAGNVPLRFYHFTGYDSGAGAAMLLRYAGDQAAAHKLWQDYGCALSGAGHLRPEYMNWRYGRFDNGQAIPLEARRVYRAREDLKKAYPDPYSASQESFWSWWQAEGRVFSSTKKSRKLDRSIRGRLGRLARSLRSKGLTVVSR